MGQAILNFLRGLLDIIDSPGGHIVLCATLAWLGYHYNDMELKAGAVAVLFRSVNDVRKALTPDRPSDPPATT